MMIQYSLLKTYGKKHGNKLSKIVKTKIKFGLSKRKSKAYLIKLKERIKLL